MLIPERLSGCEVLRHGLRVIHAVVVCPGGTRSIPGLRPAIAGVPPWHTQTARVLRPGTPRPRGGRVRRCVSARIGVEDPGGVRSRTVGHRASEHGTTRRSGHRSVEA